MTKNKTPKVKKELAKTDEVEIKPKNNFTITVILSVVILFAYKHFVEKPKVEVVKKQQEKLLEEASAKDDLLKQDINSIFADIERTGGSVKISTDKIQGEIDLQGARLDDITLSNYYTSVDKNEQVKLLRTGDTPYFVEHSWTSSDRSVVLPNIETIWSSDIDTITVDTPATLSWDNGKGLTFKKIISIDKDYMFNIEQSVKNETGRSISITPYTKIVKENPKPDPKKKERVSQQGPIGAIAGLLEEISYRKMKKEEEAQFSTDRGWFGLSDKFWLVGSIFEDNKNIEVKYEKINNHDVYEVMLEGDAQGLNNAETASSENKMFIGAKELSLLDRYMTEHSISQFDKAIDFGWYYFLTKPFYYILNFLGEMTKNFGLAILIFTIMLRIAMFPIANKSYASMMKMRNLQPKIKSLKEKYGTDKQKMQQKTMELYKKEQVSPMGGCLPMLLQIPIFFSLYKVLSISIEMRHAPFFGWIQDLSAADPTNIFNLFGLINWNPPSLLMIGVWPLLMGITMFLQQKMNPKPDDKSQAIAFTMMPIVFTFMMARFSSGLVIYWTFSNTFAIGQQWFFKKTHGSRK
jgi:YidC/Oxa1 family membrane protein insertase